MIKRKQKKLTQFYMFSDVAAILMAFFAAYALRFYTLIPSPKGVPPLKHYLIAMPLLLLFHIVHFSYQGFYKTHLRRNRLDDLFLIFLNSLVTVVILILVFSFLRTYGIVSFEISRLYLVVYFLLAVGFIFTLRLYTLVLFRRINLRPNGISHILIVGDTDLGKMVGRNLSKYKHFGLEVSGYLTETSGPHSLGTFDEFTQVVRKHHITDIFIALSLEDSKLIASLITKANNMMIDVRLVPDLVYLASLNTGLEHIEGIPVINLDATPINAWGAFFKRSFDILVSLTGLIVFLIPGLVISMIIKFSSRGPVFYLQKRVGYDGVVFRMIKFRTMAHRPEEEENPKWSRPDEKAITGPGRILRKLSLDEVPQLLNVLRGEMSLVGPRPERPEFVEKFRETIPRYMLRHRIKTGMTGWAQVHGLRGNTSLRKRIEYDIYYIKNWSFQLDLQILFRTLLKFKFINSSE